MSGLKTNLVLLGVGSAMAYDGRGEYYCFTARLRPKVVEEDEKRAENVRRGLRDLGRAMESFGLAADLEGPEWSEFRRAAQGPFALMDGKEHFGSIVIIPSPDAEVDVISRHIRAGLNAATALLRATGYYRVSIRYRPVEQLPLSDLADSTPKEEEEELSV